MKVLLVTGAGRGIGAAVAREAARAGHAVAVNHRGPVPAVVAEIVAGGGRAVALAADVTRAAEIVAMFAELDRTLGPVTALVNNAGGGRVVLGEKGTPIADVTAEQVERIVALNVASAILCTREAVRRMSTQHGGAGGAIVNLSSDQARLGGPPGFALYAAVKGAIDSLTVGLARELAGQGIRVNAVRPATIATEAQRARGPGHLARMAGTIPLGRPGTVEEVAKSVLFLLSDDASFVTGALLDVAGGR